VRSSSLLKKSLLLSAALAFVLPGCAGASSTPNAAQQAEAQADKAFERAQQENTVEAYEAVMKRYEGTDAAGRARIEVARLSAELARVAVGRGDWEEARILVTRAIELGDPIIARSAQSTLEDVDRADSRGAAQRVKGILDKDPTLQGCAKAIGIVGQTLGDAPSKLLERDLRKATLQQLSDCTQAAIEGAKPTDDFGPVRQVVTADDAKRAFGQDTQFALLTTLNDAVVAAMGAHTEKDLKAGRWKEAFAVFDAWAKEGKAGPEQVEAAKQKARDEITVKLLERGKKGLGNRTADKVLEDVLRALEVFQGMNVSADLERMRDHLTAWVECSKLRCLAEPKPKAVYNFGKATVHPSTSSTAAATSTVANGTKLWVLARSPSFSLVTTQDPGSLSTWEERFNKAQGWTQTSALKNEDTSAWLPVGPALVGERVWLPTGRDDGLYLLGIVKSVDEQDVTVEKISDGLPTTLQRTDLRSGVLAAGTKVLAFCRDTINLTEARFESVVGGDARAPRGEITCLAEDGTDDRKRQEQLGALRAKPTWLPARKP
jgi:hypothetical protein